MKNLKKEIICNPLYDDFTRENREILARANSSILELLTRAEEQNRQLSDSVRELIKLADVSTTIHRQYKNSPGNDGILKLKALLHKLKQNTMADKIHLDTALYLTRKIESDINNAFNKIGTGGEETDVQKQVKPEPKELKYKWLTFFRNGSWFIRVYNTADIIGVDKEKLFRRDDQLYYEMNGHEYEVIDPMSSPSGSKQNPLYLIRFDSLNNLYASDENGREVHASSDIVTPQLRPLKNHDKSGFAGRVRLFGTNYLLLENK